jgi:proteasome accessory factor B
VLRFDYRRPGQPQATGRSVHPWGVISWRGRWYLVGYDLDRGESRVFRLSRMEGQVKATGPAGVVTVPPGIDLRAAVQEADPGEAMASALVRLRPGSGWALRHSAVPGPDADTVLITDRDMGRIADRVVELGAQATPVDAPELAEELRKRLLGALHAHGGA